MATLTRTLELDDFGDYCLRRKVLLCASIFARLMNEEKLPGKIRVTISMEPIPSAARVPVCHANWIDWTGEKWLLFRDTRYYLRKLGLPPGKWTDIWVDWAPV